MLRVVLLFAALLATSSRGTAGTLLMAAPYNVFTLGNFNSWSGDTEGALAAGGTVNLNAYAVANNFRSDTTFFTLVAGSNLIATNGSVKGKVYDGTPGGIGQSFTIAPGKLQSGGEGPIDFAAAADQLTTLSDGLGGMAGSGCVQNYYWLQCTATKSGLNVFNIPDTSYLGNGHAPMITSTDPNATIVLNIGGKNNTLTNGGWSISGVSPQHVLLNFYETVNLTLNGSVPVSILAPDARVTLGGSGALNGNFIAYSFTGQYQFNNTLFTGDLPTFESSEAAPVPEPATLAMTGGALIALGVWASRRRR